MRKLLVFALMLAPFFVSLTAVAAESDGVETTSAETSVAATTDAQATTAEAPAEMAAEPMPEVPEAPAPNAEAVTAAETAPAETAEAPASENLEFISGEITALDEAAKTITVKLYGEAESGTKDKLLTIQIDDNTDLTDGEKDRELSSLAAGTEVDVEYDPASNKATYIFVY